MKANSLFIVVVLKTCVSAVFAYESRHKVWPACRVELYSEASIVLRTLSVDTFVFDYRGHIDPILRAAQDRLLSSIGTAVPDNAGVYPINPEKRNLWPLVGIRINVLSDDTELRHGIDERYELQVRPIIDNDGYILLEAVTVYGAMHGLQTLQQLIEFGWLADGQDDTPVYLIRDTPLQIIDAPTYPYRGLMIDTARHYLPLALVLHNLDAMAMNKLNVLHWHMTDSQSWPYQSSAFPELSRAGSYCPECIYSVDVIKMVIEHATARGIRVIPEFDLPGHSLAISASYPALMTDCGDAGPSEPLDATNPAVYDFVRALYDEISGIWPDQWMHVGGDEVSLDCWKNSTKIQKWIIDHNMTDEVQLLDYFEQHLLDYVSGSLERRPIVWQDLFDSGVALSPHTVIDVWKSWDTSGARYEATRKSYQVLFSACWYLDHLNEDWTSFYECDPRDFNGTNVQKSLVVGGHASMWGERVDETNFLSRVWPRSSAVAEKLWTGNASAAFRSAKPRLETFRCFMIRNGVPASPIAPGGCYLDPPLPSLRSMSS